MWCYCHKLCLYSIADVEFLYELVYRLLRHLLVCTGKCLQCLVWMRICLTTKYRLDSLSHDSPCVVEVGAYLVLVEDQLVQALQSALDCYHAMAQRHSNVTENCRVGKVALQTAYRELLCEELKNGIRHTHITLTVLEVDRIHLVRHCT